MEERNRITPGRAVAVLILGCLCVLLPGRAALADDPPAVLLLEPTPESLYVRPDEAVVVALRVLDLVEPVKACQAFLGYDSTYLWAEDVAEGGGDWDDLIYEQVAVGGKIDMAVGVLGDTQGGTMDPGVVAWVQFRAGFVEGRTVVVFRPDLSDIESTFLATMDATELWPRTFSSPEITIDGTPPSVSIRSVTQGGRDLLAAGQRAWQGAVRIVVDADDVLAGLDGPPEVTVTPEGALGQAVSFVEQQGDGGYVYEFTVSAETPNGEAAVVAVAGDRSGNRQTSDAVMFEVNKNRISGYIELQSFVGTSRDVVFVATGVTQRTWLVHVSGFVSSAAPYHLDDVPDGLTALSAKTSWSLRRRMAVTLDGEGQALGDFTDASKLLGGDLNASNYVNTRDYVILKENWYSTHPLADINGDGVVNSVDYTILKWNWYKIGDEE